jgi:type VI secretion system protein VasI
MKKTLFILSIFPFLALANDSLDKKIDTCKSMTDSKQRLSCYDSLFERKVEVKSDENNMGKWVVTEDVSPIDDSKTVMLTLDADTPIQVRYGEKTPYLVIRCKEKITEMYIGFDTFLGSNTIYPTTRIDSEKAVSNMKWSIATNHSSMFYHSSNNKTSVKITDFLKNLQTKNKYFVQVTPYSENPVNTTFTITGLDEAIKPLRAACGW